MAFEPAPGGRQEGHGVKIHNLGVIRAALEAGHGVDVHGAPAKGLPLHSNGHLGADMLFIRGGDEFPVHTHPGDHLLYCLAGRGTITVAGVTYKIRPGDIYMVEGMVPHAVGAETDHVLVAIGSPHKAVDAPDRMTWVDWDGNTVAEPQQAAGPTADPTDRAWLDSTPWDGGPTADPTLAEPIAYDRAAHPEVRRLTHGGQPPTHFTPTPIEHSALEDLREAKRIIEENPRY